MFPYVGFQFLFFEKLKIAALQYGILGTSKTRLNANQKLIVGALSGTASVVCTYPLDFARGMSRSDAVVSRAGCCWLFFVRNELLIKQPG